MGQVSVILNGRTYRLACGDGEEARLANLARHVKSKVDDLAAKFGQVGEERLFLMAALLVADELFEIREPRRTTDDVPDVAPASAMSQPALPVQETTPVPPTAPQLKLPGKPPQPALTVRKPSRAS